jgi:hypothetical protein
MENVKEVNNSRDHLHFEIVREATCVNTIEECYEEGVLQLDTPMEFRNYVVDAVCCETGLLLSTNHDTIIPYRNLTLDELYVLRNYIVTNKNYKFVIEN